MRLDYGVELIWRDAPDSGRQIIKALKDGRVVCALLDQDSNLTNSFAPFFGIQAASPSGPIQLAIRHRVPLFTSFIVRTSPLEHRIETVEIPYDLNDQQAAQKALEVYNQRLESFILRYPDQWIWWHRRWRRRPNVNYKEQPELLRSTEEYIKWLDSAV
jgi:KDO2-lipid IV(A) lauroyltransferase